MPLAGRTLTTKAVAQLSAAMFAPSDRDAFGIEVEWPVHRNGDLSARPQATDIALLEGATLPAGGRITFEPGGQIELSTAPAQTVVDALRAAHDDAEALRSELAAAGLVCETLAVDDRRPPRRILQRPRYEAMENFFASQGHAGTWMMCNTAATQVNISIGRTSATERWHTMNLIAPVMIAAFANSPGFDADGRHWASLRQAIWWSIDPPRTRPVRADASPVQAWQDYALAADVMFINDEGSWGTSGTGLRPGFSFARWMAEGHDAGWPTIEDYRYHLSTLFPPVRPRGWLELRVLDALPGWLRDVATLTVATACTTDASRELRRRLPETSGLWTTAARDGIEHPTLSCAARILMEIVADNLAGVSDEPNSAHLVEQYRTDYVNRGRSPGSDLGSEADVLRPHPVPALTCV